MNSNIVQLACEHHEWIEATYTDSAGNISTTSQCRKCGQLLPVSHSTLQPSSTPSPSQEAEVRAKAAVQDIAERLQKECHATVEYILKNTKGANVQDATNVFIYRSLAELEYKITALNQL